MVGGQKRGLQPAGAERRQGLVEAAYRRIAEHGLDGLRTRAVATDAGIDHTTLHHYFRTKQDLVAAVVEYATGQFRHTTPDEGTAADRLREHLSTLARMLAERPDLFVVTRELDLLALRDPAVQAVIRSHEEGWRKSLTPLFQEAAAEGVLPAVATELVINVVKGASFNPAGATAVLEQLSRLIVRA